MTLVNVVYIVAAEKDNGMYKATTIEYDHAMERSIVHKLRIPVHTATV